MINSPVSGELYRLNQCGSVAPESCLFNYGNEDYYGSKGQIVRCVSDLENRFILLTPQENQCITAFMLELHRLDKV